MRRFVLVVALCAGCKSPPAAPSEKADHFCDPAVGAFQACEAANDCMLIHEKLRYTTLTAAVATKHEVEAQAALKTFGASYAGLENFGPSKAALVSCEEHRCTLRWDEKPY